MLSMIQQTVERRLAASGNHEIRMQSGRPIRAPRRFVKRRAAAEVVEEEVVDEPGIQPAVQAALPEPPAQFALPGPPTPAVGDGSSFLMSLRRRVATIWTRISRFPLKP